MIIDIDKWNELKESFRNFYENYDTLNDAGKDLIDNVDICIEEIDNTKTNKVYVITDNAIVDDEIDYHISGVALNEKQAKELLNETIRNIKIDSDFENLDAVDLNSDNRKEIDEEWCFDETDDSFELYLNGEYNSNNFSAKIIEFNIDSKLDLESELS